MGRIVTAQSLAEDKWFIGYYEFVGICMREHVRQRLCRWQAAWSQWQVCTCMRACVVCPPCVLDGWLFPCVCECKAPCPFVPVFPIAHCAAYP